MPEKNVLDWAWVHGTAVVEGNRKFVKCNYCSHLMRSGITCLKKHLARIEGAVRPCPLVPKAVLNGCRENFEECGPYKIMTLKEKQNKVPLSTDDEIAEEPEKKFKNGKALDSAWLHGTPVVEGKFNQVRCNYCLKVINTSITGLKKHLAKLDVGVTPCPSVPQVVSDGFRDNFEETGPHKFLNLKRNQKKVPLWEGQSDVTPEEHSEQSANAEPTLLVTKTQSSPSNSGHTALVKGMSNRKGKTGKEVAERVAEHHKVNLTDGDRSPVKTRGYSAKISSGFTPIINVEDSSSDDEIGPHTSQTGSQVRIHKHKAHISPACIPIINVEDSSSDDETDPHTSLTDTSSKKMRTADAFDPHQRARSSNASSRP